MTFTDDDLKALKEQLPFYEHSGEKRFIEALLARLEAESECADILECIYKDDDCSYCTAQENESLDATTLHEKNCEVARAIEARRKACGK